MVLNISQAVAGARAINMYVNGNMKQDKMTANPSKYPQGYFNEKPCKECGTIFKPMAPSHLYCSQNCTDIGFNRAYLKRNYKLTLEEWKELKEKQNSLCAICLQVGFKIDPASKNLLVVDHYHETGRVRGLLCHNCNRALGLLADDTDRLKRAIAYLDH